MIRHNGLPALLIKRHIKFGQNNGPVGQTSDSAHQGDRRWD